MYIDSSGNLIHNDNKLEPVLGIYNISDNPYNMNVSNLFFSTEIPF